MLKVGKGSLINAVCEKTGASQYSTNKAVSAVMSALVDILIKEGKLTLNGIGRFTVCTRAARNGRNPLTGESIFIPEKKTLRFFASPKIKTQLNA